MRAFTVTLIGTFLLLSLAIPAMAANVILKISGKGAVNDSTIKAGEPVSVDLYIENDVVRTGFTLGLSIESNDFKTINHTPYVTGGMNENGDIQGHNGWQDKSVWDLGGVYVVERDWDGTLPDLIGFGGVSVRQEFKPRKLFKALSFNLVMPDPGSLVIDSAFFPPGGKWLFASPPRIAPSENPGWGGPYHYKVIK